MTGKSTGVLTKTPLKRLSLLDTAVKKRNLSKLKKALPDAAIEIGARPAEAKPSEAKGEADEPVPNSEG